MIHGTPRFGFALTIIRPRCESRAENADRQRGCSNQLHYGDHTFLSGELTRALLTLSNTPSRALDQNRCKVFVKRRIRGKTLHPRSHLSFHWAISLRLVRRPFWQRDLVEIDIRGVQIQVDRELIRSSM